MHGDALALAALFICTMSFTPGPANLSMLSVGASVGLSRALPYLLGVWLGGLAVVAAGAAGLGALFVAAPKLFLAMKIVGFVYICWLAWKLARAGFGGSAHEIAPSFWAGAGLHPVNPKAYVQVGMVFSSFVTPGTAYLPQAALLGTLCFGTMVAATSLWGMGGDAIRRFTHNERAMRLVAVTASLLMVVSVGAAILL
ncbi:threonine/homoserine/homoserine lactone efflux protein [Parvibaculum indicum]|uniref:LysE family translocator n=1 Tax=Parvibaculum indicum TaxID=562969 RepID=UPI0014231B30|nr:LysE family transporter [Parvibaculum indicum]NIJ40452.1 threonine/homoserine/homoserine lactone efflux protein [Parvibaculum indicum]